MQPTYDKLIAEVPKYKMITVSILCDRLRLTCSLARKGIAILMSKGLIKPVTTHHKQNIYTRATNEIAEEVKPAKKEKAKAVVKEDEEEA